MSLRGYGLPHDRKMTEPQAYRLCIIRQRVSSQKAGKGGEEGSWRSRWTRGGGKEAVRATRVPYLSANLIFHSGPHWDHPGSFKPPDA